MNTNEFEQFAKAFRCSMPMAESIVLRIRQRVGRDVPMGEILGAIKKIAPTRLTTDSIVLRLQKAGAIRPDVGVPSLDFFRQRRAPKTKLG